MSLRVLLLVTERYSANGICAISIAKALVARGDQVLCVVNKEYGDEDDFEQDGISFLTVRPRLVYSVNSMLKRKRNISQLKRIFYSISCWFINKVELFLSLPSWPVISRAYSKRIYKCIEKASIEKNVDVIIPVYTQIDTIIAANMYKRDNNQVMVIPYFLDSLAAGYGPKIMSKRWIERRGLKWENKLLKDADHIVMMKSSEPFYRERQDSLHYFSKISFLDLPLFEPKSVPDNNNRIKEILYVGTIPGHIRNPKFFLEVFSKIDDDNLKLTIIGPSTCESLIQEYAIKDNRITRIQSVSHSEAVDRIIKADILLNLGNNLSSMTPSKIFEYISTGKPIISTAPIANEPCIPYLSKYGNACVLYEDKGIEDSVALLKRFMSHATRIDPQSLDGAFYLNQPKAFLRVVDRLFSNI